jgi:protein-arginine kinase activator protein McsA
LRFLLQWKDEIISQRDSHRGMAVADAPEDETKLADETATIREQLKSAIVEERYEDAARLRNELEQRDHDPPKGREMA